MVVLVAGCSSSGSDTTAGSSAKATTTRVATTTTSAPKAAPLKDQTPPSSINGIAVQGDTIWVASIKGDEILQVDRQTGAILQRFDTKGAGPDDIAIAPDGSIYSAGFGNGDVGHIANGKYSVFTTIKPGINPIEFSPDGLLYIGTYGPDGELFQLDPSDPKSFTKSLGGGLPDINAFGIIADGTIVAPAGGVAGPGSAIAIEIVPVKQDKIGGKGISTIVKGLPGVAAGTTDSQGRPYVLANATGQVFAINLDDKTSQVVQTVKKGGPFDNLSFAHDGTLYLSSFIAPTITEVAPDGTERVIPIGS